MNVAKVAKSIAGIKLKKLVRIGLFQIELVECTEGSFCRVLEILGHSKRLFQVAWIQAAADLVQQLLRKHIYGDISKGSRTMAATDGFVCGFVSSILILYTMTSLGHSLRASFVPLFPLKRCFRNVFAAVSRCALQPF